MDEDRRAPGLLPEPAAPESAGPVECLGLTFDSEAARREYFLQRLREKLPELRRRPDFPAGEDEDILRLSDPPYYTACPNPFLGEFVERCGRPWNADEPYHREPFAADVSEGKTDPLYKAHGYHTKVPHKAIAPSILHYTEPGDVVLDGFCGSGMTGVAAQWCGTAPAEYRREIEQRWLAEGKEEPPQWGARRAVLGDLSPAATFIAANYNTPFDVNAFAAAARKLLDEVDAEIGWMYETPHTDGKTKGRINYTVWSEVFTCPECTEEVVFIKEALDEKSGQTRTEFPCPHCAAKLSKRNLERSFETLIDPASGKPWMRIRLRAVLIDYNVDKKRYQKEPDSNDLSVMDLIRNLGIPSEMPTNALPIDEMYHGSRLAPKGFTYLHHMFLPRAAHALAAMWRRANAYEDQRLRNMLLFFVEQAIVGMTLMNRHHVVGRANVNQSLPGVYYIPSIHEETAYWRILEGKLERLINTFSHSYTVFNTSIVRSGDCAKFAIPGNSIDYIFTDPPFGENIYYADLNYLVESWHRVFTRGEPEAIVDRANEKTIADYQRLMHQCFEEYCRVLKPGRWMTVVFHNSKNAVWNAIQEAMSAAGFVVADVRTLDKQQGSFRQVTSTAVKQDLVISAYKPNGGLEERFKLSAGTEAGAWDFVRTHLGNLPVFVAKEGNAEIVAERLHYLLFDRMVAFHVRRSVMVPLSAAEFYEGLAQRFPERDGMYFLPEQASEYEKKRLKAGEVRQLVLFVRDEETAIRWLKQQLGGKPQTFQEIHPQFMREIGGWRKYEKTLELLDLLKENFLCWDGAGEAPGAIHGYLSRNFKELRNKPKDSPALRAKGRNRWYAPDPSKAADLERLRERALLREFDEYRKEDARRLRVLRLEAVRAGFKRAWQAGDYETIAAVARRIPDKVLREDSKLIMWHDQAVTRIEARS